MFNLFRNSQPHHPSTALAQALVGDGLPLGLDPATLSVLERRGSYSGRSVTYFRVFDPVRLAERNLAVRDYSDLDSHPDLVLGSGHREQDGVIVLTRQARPSLSSTYAREEAIRSKHTDDQQFVFPDRQS
jgi:hypothetical protein